MMSSAQFHVFNLQIDTPFKRPRPLDHPDTRRFEEWLCDPEGFRLRPDQVRLKSWDRLFGYEILANFFGENGFLLCTCDRVRVGVKNARNAADWEIIQNLFVRLLQHESPAEGAMRTFSASAHVRLEEPQTAETFLERFAVVPGVHRPAALSYVKIADWEKEIRIVIEPSNLFPQHLFLTWDSQFGGSQDWDTFVPSLLTVMENSARMFDLGLAPLS